jgi:hypothetical protein
MDAENYSVTVVCTSGDTAQTNIRINQIRAQKLASRNNIEGGPKTSAKGGTETVTTPPPVTRPVTTTKPPAAPAQKSKLPLILGAALAALLAAALLAFFFLKDSGKTAEPEAAAPAAEAAKEDEAPKPAEEKAPEAKPSEEKAPEAPKPAEEKTPEAPQDGAPAASTPAPQAAPEAAPSAHSAGATPREKVRTFFANPGRTAKAAMELAKELEIKTQDDAEAQFRLHYFAANNDEASAYVPYARALDPSQPAVGSVKKDPADARVFYEKAGDTASVEAMKKFIDERAAAGDKDAKAWQSQLK